MTDWRSGFIAAFISQAAVLAALLWGRREREANRWLAALLLALIGVVSVYPLGWHGRNEVPVWLTFLPINLPLALGPLLYFHTRSVAQSPLPKSAWLHFGPTALHFAYLVTLSMLPIELALCWKEDVHDDIVKPLVEMAVLASLAGYGVLSLIVLRRFRARLVAWRSDADLHDVRWLSRLLITLLVSFAIIAGVRLYAGLVAEVGSGIHLLWLAAWSAWLAVEGWRAAGVPTPDIAEVLQAERSGRDWRALGNDWHDRTRAAGWWREPDLTLAGLARRLGTNTLYLSRAINDGLKMNFNEMVNRMRAEEVARAIERGEGKADLLPLALAAGFSSKTTFNRAFRAAYGMNPSEYRRRFNS